MLKKQHEHIGSFPVSTKGRSSRGRPKLSKNKKTIEDVDDVRKSHLRGSWHDHVDVLI